MKKKVAVVNVAQAEEAARVADLPLEATVALAEVAGAVKDGLLAFASATGLVVMRQMMDAELTGRIGQKHAKVGAGDRVDNWHGTTTGSVVLGGRQVSAERPRARTVEGTEIELDTYKVSLVVVAGLWKIVSTTTTTPTGSGLAFSVAVGHNLTPMKSPGYLQEPEPDFRTLHSVLLVLRPGTRLPGPG